MTKQIGLWIDQREAVLVSLAGEAETITRIASEVGRPKRYTTRAEPLKAEDMLDRRQANYLRQYYQKVVAAVREADAIFIFGPGEAKGELAKQLEAANLGGRVVGLEPADKLTDRQIAARVRAQFAPAP